MRIALITIGFTLTTAIEVGLKKIRFNYKWNTANVSNA